MADIGSDILSNLSLGLINQVPNIMAPLASQLYAPSSVSPVDTVALNLKRTTVTESYSYPGDRPKYYMKIEVMGYHRFDGNGGNLFQVSRLDLQNTIYLPLPMQLVDNNQVIYSETELGLGAGSLIQAGDTALNKTNNTQSATSSVTGNLSVVAGAAGIGAAQGVLDKALKGRGPNIASLASTGAALAGYTPNQFLTILLKAPAYKRHSFTWLLSPHNESEAKNLQQIIRYINNAKAPGVFAGGSLFTFPSVFRCSIMPNPQFMYKFKPAVMESFTVDYTGGGLPAFMRRGSQGFNAPSVLQINMTFLELEYWLNQNYADNNDENDVSTGTP